MKVTLSLIPDREEMLTAGFFPPSPSGDAGLLQLLLYREMGDIWELQLKSTSSCRQKAQEINTSEQYLPALQSISASHHICVAAAANRAKVLFCNLILANAKYHRKKTQQVLLPISRAMGGRGQLC